MQRRSELLEKVETFQNMLISYATGVPHDDAEYKKLREDLLSEPSLKDKLPRFVRTCRDVKQFWVLMKQKSDNYQGRRVFLWEEFAPALQALEQPGSPADKPVSDLLAQFDPEHIHQIWERALARRAADSEGAITSARTLLETVVVLFSLTGHLVQALVGLMAAVETLAQAVGKRLGG